MNYQKDRTVVIPAPLEAELREYAGVAGERHGYLIGHREINQNRCICDALFVGSSMDQYQTAELIGIRQKMVNFKMAHPEYNGIVVHTQHRPLSIHDKSRYNSEMVGNPDFLAIVYTSCDAAVKRSVVKPKSSGNVHIEISSPRSDFERKRLEILAWLK